MKNIKTILLKFYLINFQEPITFIFEENIEDIFDNIKNFFSMDNYNKYFKIKDNNQELYFNPNKVCICYAIDLDSINKQKYNIVLYNKHISKEVTIPFLNQINLNEKLKNNTNKNFIDLSDNNTILFTNDITAIIIKENVLEYKVENEIEIKYKEKIIKEDKTEMTNKNDFEFEIITEDNKL